MDAFFFGEEEQVAKHIWMKFGYSTLKQEALLLSSGGVFLNAIEEDDWRTVICRLGVGDFGFYHSPLKKTWISASLRSMPGSCW